MKKIIYILLSFFILLAGICYAATSSDSITSPALLSVGNHAVLEEASIAPVEFSHAEELVSRTAVSSFMESVSHSTKSALYTFSILLLWAVLLFVLSAAHLQFISQTYEYLESHQIITHFIHKKDGKKRR